MPYARQNYIKERLSLNLARLKKGGEKFEVILEDPDKALELREGKQADVRDILQSPEIFSDAKKSQLAPESDIKKIFSTEDAFKIAEEIIKKGEIQLTEEHRTRIFEQKKRQVLEYIHQNTVDPKTKLPHPIKRLELAFEEAKIRIDPSDTVSWQVDKILPKLQTILPLSVSKMQLKVTIPAKYAGSAYGTLKSKYNLIKERWNDDGSVSFESIGAAGLKLDVIGLINKLTNGEAMIEDIGK